jgi:hypothetical protein
VYEGTVRYCLKNAYSVAKFAGKSLGARTRIRAGGFEPRASIDSQL